MNQFLQRSKEVILGILAAIVGILALVNIFKKNQQQEIIKENDKVNDEIRQLESQKQDIDDKLQNEEVKRKELEDGAKEQKDLSNEDLAKFFNDRK